MKKQLSVLLAGGALATFALGFQGTASAAAYESAADKSVTVMGWPTGCEYNKVFINGGAARCAKGNGGHYKAVANCARWDGTGVVVREAGKWVSSGWSLVYCPPETHVASAGITMKAS
ncbi:hypothetical protein ACFYXH_37755 [Streptomyces sp. NPDC002730]|uniref:hypothetical protein n=1 Tax=Streptomyces sp. NPDC002730 TaxID=3364662 RepID=UPI0036B0FBA0